MKVRRLKSRIKMEKKRVSTLTKSIANLFYQLRYRWYFDSSCDGDGVNSNSSISRDGFMIDYRVEDPYADDGFVGYITIKLTHETFTEEDLKNSLNEIEEAIERDHTFIHTYINPTGEMLIDQLFIGGSEDRMNPDKTWKSKFKYFGPNKVKVKVYTYHFEDVENMGFCGFHLYLLAGLTKEKVIDNFKDFIYENEDNVKYIPGEASMNFKYPISMDRDYFSDLYDELCRRHDPEFDFERDEKHQRERREYRERKEKEIMDKYKNDSKFEEFQKRYPEPFHFSYSEHESLFSYERSYYMHLSEIEGIKREKMEKELSKKFVEEWIDKVEIIYINLDEIMEQETHMYDFSTTYNSDDEPIEDNDISSSDSEDEDEEDED